MKIVVDYSELCFLLAEVGVNAPVGVDITHFRPPNETEKQEVLQAGQAKLRMREDQGEQALARVLASPTAVLHATRVQEDKPDEDIWFFYTPSQTVQLQKTAENQYELAAIGGETAVIDQIQQFLPLQPVPPDLIYQIKLPYEEFLALRDLATDWKEVPALLALEADGLEQIAARDLFDSAVAPEWRGIIDCLTCKEQTVTSQTTIRVLQGAEISWVIEPSDDGELIIETARPNIFHHVLAKTWEATLAS